MSAHDAGLHGSVCLDKHAAKQDAGEGLNLVMRVRMLQLASRMSSGGIPGTRCQAVNTEYHTPSFLPKCIEPCPSLSFGCWRAKCATFASHQILEGQRYCNLDRFPQAAVADSCKLTAQVCILDSLEAPAPCFDMILRIIVPSRMLSAAASCRTLQIPFCGPVTRDQTQHLVTNVIH